MKKLLFIVGALKMGGVQTQILRYAVSLGNRNTDVVVISLVKKNESDILNSVKDSATVRYLEDFLSPFCRLVSKLDYSAVTHSLPLNSSAVIKILSDVDYIHATDSETNIVALRLSNILKKPFVSCSYHPNEYYWTNGFYFRKVQLELVKKMGFRNTYFMNDTVFEKTKQRVCYAGKTDSAVIIPLGVKCNKNKITKDRYQSNKIITIGRLADFKKYNEILIALLDKINYKLKKSKQLELHIYGDGALLDKLKKIASQQSSKIYFHGTIPYRSIGKIFKEAFVFVGMGTTLIEASEQGTVSIIGAGNFDKKLTYGHFYSIDNFLSGEKCSQCRMEKYEDLLINLRNLTEKNYLEIQHLNVEKSKRFDIEIITTRLIRYLHQSTLFNFNFNEFRYFFSNLAWLAFNFTGIKSDRRKRYREIEK